jgi:hypothetical protein
MEQSFGPRWRRIVKEVRATLLDRGIDLPKVRSEEDLLESQGELFLVSPYLKSFIDAQPDIDFEGLVHTWLEDIANNSPPSKKH